MDREFLAIVLEIRSFFDEISGLVGEEAANDLIVSAVVSWMREKGASETKIAAVLEHVASQIRSGEASARAMWLQQRARGERPS